MVTKLFYLGTNKNIQNQSHNTLKNTFEVFQMRSRWKTGMNLMGAFQLFEKY